MVLIVNLIRLKMAYTSVNKLSGSFTLWPHYKDLYKTTPLCKYMQCLPMGFKLDNTVGQGFRVNGESFFRDSKFIAG